MIIGASLTHNDKSKGWLENWLNTNSQYLDKWIILDDTSDDGTDKIINEYKSEKCEIITGQLDKPTFKEDEIKVRSILWNLVREHAKHGDWILILDSDELLTYQFSNIKEYTKDNDTVLVFKKHEMWNEDEYRIDGLWSNYFSRMIAFKDLDFGYEGKKGFHYPAIPEYTKNFKKFNTNIPIQHLAYSSEELRKNKYQFMCSNQQQEKDLNWLHFQTINNVKPVLKKINNNEKLKLLININLVNLYTIPTMTKNFITKALKLSNLEFNFIVSNCHKKVYEDVKNFCENEKCIDTYISRLYPTNNKLQRQEEIKGLIINQDLKDYDGIFILDGEQEFNEFVLQRIINLDKNVFINHPYNTLIYLDKKILEELKNSNLDFNKQIEYISSNHLIWSNIMTIPSILQLNVHPKLLGLGAQNEHCNT